MLFVTSLSLPTQFHGGARILEKQVTNERKQCRKELALKQRAVATDAEQSGTE